MEQIETKPEKVNMQSVYDYYSASNQGSACSRFVRKTSEDYIESPIEEEPEIVKDSGNPNKEDEE